MIASQEELLRRLLGAYQSGALPRAVALQAGGPQVLPLEAQGQAGHSPAGAHITSSPQMCCPHVTCLSTRVVLAAASKAHANVNCVLQHTQLTTVSGWPGLTLRVL